MNKRTFIKSTLVASAGAALLSSFYALAGNKEHKLPALPYAPAALEPHIDAKTMQVHHGKHHKAYVDNLNKAIVGTPYANASLQALQTMMDKAPAAVRNNGGGHYNHTLFFALMSPKSTGKPSGALDKAITAAFTNLDGFKAAFEKEAKSIFGSGWAWLCKNPDGTLFITTTPNQDNPLMPLPGVRKGTPVLALDVWEHAYYLKNQNRRADYITSFWSVVNWAQCEKLYAAK